MSEKPSSPAEVLRARLAQKGWSQADLAQVIDKTAAAVNELVQGKRTISSEMAALLGAALGTDASFWLTLESDRHSGNRAIADARQRSRLFELAPIREMIRRGWIKQSDSIDGAEAELKAFFGVESLDTPPQLPVATRRTDPIEDLTPSQRAWCFRARNMASDLVVCPFDKNRLDDCLAQLRKLTAFAPEARKVAKTLGEYGIRFVVVEPLSGSKIDGAAMWLDENKPVIALSLRMDRIDAFWFTLLHEFAHILHEDGLSVDSDLTGNDRAFSVTKSPMEMRADNAAADMLVPSEKLLSFIRRVAPLYSKARIIQFAHRIRVHPGIILGQLQYRGEVPYRANREMLAKIRERVASSSFADGWGNLAH